MKRQNRAHSKQPGPDFDMLFCAIEAVFLLLELRNKTQSLTPMSGFPIGCWWILNYYQWMTKQGWIKLNFRCSSTSCVMFHTVLWANHVVLGGFLVPTDNPVLTPGLHHVSTKWSQNSFFFLLHFWGLFVCLFYLPCLHRKVCSPILDPEY